MPRIAPERKLEMGRRVALKEITPQEAAKEYGCHVSLAWDARKKWLATQTPATFTVKDVFLDKPAPDKGPTRPPVDHTYVDELQKENQRLHDEVRTLQKIVMTLGSAL